MFAPWKWGGIYLTFSTFHPVSQFPQNFKFKHRVKKWDRFVQEQLLIMVILFAINWYYLNSNVHLFQYSVYQNSVTNEPIWIKFDDTIVKLGNKTILVTVSFKFGLYFSNKKRVFKFWILSQNQKFVISWSRAGWIWQTFQIRM